MRKELDEKLCKDHPEIFKHRDGDPKQTAMCWGMECGDGWYDIIDALCFCLENDYYQAKWRHKKESEKLEEARQNVPFAVQVKEKYGTLRFYTGPTTEEQYMAIRFAEVMSSKICEVCGSPGKLRQGGWMRTLCDVHAKEAGYEEEGG